MKRGVLSGKSALTGPASQPLPGEVAGRAVGTASVASRNALCNQVKTGADAVPTLPAGLKSEAAEVRREAAAPLGRSARLLAAYALEKVQATK
jgi:hypothetical protein